MSAKIGMSEYITKILQHCCEFEFPISCISIFGQIIKISQYQLATRSTSMRNNIFFFTICQLAIQAHFFDLGSSSSPSELQQRTMNQNDPKVCDGNRFKYISTYALGKQNDLNLTFHAMQKQTYVDKVVYKDQIFRTYTIFPLTMEFAYGQASQNASTIGSDRIKVSGGSLRISYSFKWEKKQLSGLIEGTGKGAVRTDPISFIKSLSINADTKTFEWNFVSADPIAITNSLTMSEFKPYKAADYDVVNQMLNELKSGEPTVKTMLLHAMNANFTKILAKYVHENNETWKEPQKIYYDYTDPHGSFSTTFDNIMLSFSLSKGLDLLLSQSIQNDTKFDCGQKVPTDPLPEKSYGGIQQYISNSLFNSTLLNAMNKGFLDAVLTEEFWQSPAFQFYMGDVHDVIPSTKTISSLEPITGKCKALANNLAFKMKTTTTYQVSTNFTCDLKFLNNTKNLLGLNLSVDYQIQVVPLASTLDFVIRAITGNPTFIEYEDFKIKNMDLALFMVEQTLKMARNSKVLGSGFKVIGKKNPKVQIRQKYMIVYDAPPTMNPTGKQRISKKQKKVMDSRESEF